MRTVTLTSSALALAASALLALPAQAADFGVSAQLGTTGVGLHLSTAIAENVNARVGVNFLNYNRSASTSGVNYDASLRLQTVDLLADWFPSGGNFRVSAGLVVNNNKVDATGKPAAGSTYTLNGNTYTLGSLAGDVTFNKTAPYLGLGWGNTVRKDKGWSFVGDLGVIFAGTPRSNLQANGCTGAACATLANDLATENAKLQDDLKALKLFPVLRLGVGYAF